jgi:large subunit ribosomal protein L24e
MPKCNFCGKNIEEGTGKMVVQTTGKILRFCSSKCEKNLLKLKRKPRDFKWTESYERTSKK